MIFLINSGKGLEHQGMMRNDKVKASFNCVVNDLLGYVKNDQSATYLRGSIGKAHYSVIIPRLAKRGGNALFKFMVKLFCVHIIFLSKVAAVRMK